MKKGIPRRQAIKNVGLGSLALASISTVSAKNKNAKNIKNRKFELKGNINHSVCQWCYGSIPLDDFAKSVSELGVKAIDILNPDQWDTVEKYGLVCSVARDSQFARVNPGFNDTSLHEMLQKGYKGLIDKCADRGIPAVIAFSGNEGEMDRETGLENCAVGLEPVAKYAEKRGITIVFEMLNSKVNHPGYQFDNTPYAVELVEKIGSPNFKLLYDIYHMQIMEGDIIATIKKYHKYIGHYHTGGVPGRNEINQKQELNYPAIMKAILDTGYKGYVAQEYIPTYDDKIEALKEGILICDV